MEGLFDNLERRSDSQNFEPLTSTFRFSPCAIGNSFSLVENEFCKFMSQQNKM